MIYYRRSFFIDGNLPTKFGSLILERQNMKKIWRQIEIWLEANTPEVYSALAKPATERQIEDAEKHLGVKLPRAVKDSYLIHDGTKYETLLDGWEILSLKNAVDAWKFLKELFDEGTLDVDCRTDSEFIKPVWWHERWIPILYDRCGNYLCADLAPQRGGKRGQIIAYYHDEDKRYLLADGLENYLRDFAENLAANRYQTNKYGSVELIENE